MIGIKFIEALSLLSGQDTGPGALLQGPGGQHHVHAVMALGAAVADVGGAVLCGLAPRSYTP